MAALRSAGAADAARRRCDWASLRLGVGRPLGACGSRGCWERSAVTLSVGAFSVLARLRNTKPKGTGSARGPGDPGGNDPATDGVLGCVPTVRYGCQPPVPAPVTRMSRVPAYTLGGSVHGAHSSLGR